METGRNLLKLTELTNHFPHKNVDGWVGQVRWSGKEKFPTKVDVTKLMCQKATKRGASQRSTNRCLAVIIFFGLLPISEYAVSGSKKKDKQTIQFRVKDDAFLVKRNDRLRQLPADATDNKIRSAVSVTLPLENQKNSWKMYAFISMKSRVHGCAW